MKKISTNLLKSISLVLFSSIIVCYFGGDIVLADEPTPAEEQSNKVLTTEEKNLYYGYNLTGGKALMEADAIPKVHPIIDLNSDYPIQRNPFSGEQENMNFSGSSMKEVEKEFALSVVSGTEAQIYMFNANLNVAFNLDKKVSNVYSEYYEMYSCRIEKESYVVHDLTLDEIRDYLAPGFVEDINNVRSVADAEALFSKYGTHLSNGYKYGGLMNITNYKTTSDSSVQLNQGLSLETKISGAIANATAGKNASITETYAESETTSEMTSSYNFKSYGGDAISSVTIDSLFTYNPAINGSGKYEYGRWVDSINSGTNLAIIGVANGCELIPLWELLEPDADPSIRSYLINAYVEMCGDKYEEYSNMYPSLDRSITQQSRSEDSSVPVIDGAFVRTPHDYFYYVDVNDFSESGNHNEIHQGDILYLCMSDSLSGNYEFDQPAGCEILNNRSCVFKVTGNGGSQLTIKYAGNDKNVTLLTVPIKNSSFEGGAGTKEYPYLICNSEQFLNTKNSSKKTYYQLLNDIDFEEREIQPLGTFKGILDGNYCTLSNFTIGESESWGLYNEIDEGAEIRNLKITNAGSGLGDNSYSECKKAVNADKRKKENAVSSSKAGILCGVNKGKISGCYIEKCFVGVVDLKQLQLSNGKAELCAGALVGINSGHITDSMVRNSSVLCAYIDEGDDNKNNIYVYASGFIGKADSGSVERCVVANDNKHYIHAITGNNNELNLIKSDNEIRTYACGLIGYCTKNSGVRIEKVYVQINSENLKAENENFGKIGVTKSNPDVFHHLTSIAIIAADKDPKLSNCYYYCDTKEDLNCYLIPKSGKNDKFDTNDDEFNKQGNSKLTDADKLSDEMSEGYYYSDDQDNIEHMLNKKRSEYISFVVDDSNSVMKNAYCLEDVLTIKGLSLKERIREEDDYSGLIVFNITLKQNGQNVDIDDPFDVDGSEVYSVGISQYEGEVAINEPLNIDVSENAVVDMLINCDSEDAIYLDKVEDYIDAWSPDSLTITILLSNGESLSKDDPEYANIFDVSKLELVTTADELINGDNYLRVKYSDDGREILGSYIISVVERQVISIEIVDSPTKLEYKAGEPIELSGIKVKVNYDQGTSEMCDSLDKLSIIGDVVAEGENDVVVIYDGHLNCGASFKVTGVANPKAEIEDTTSGHGKVIFIIVVSIVLLGGGAGAAFILLKKRNPKGK